MQDASKNTTQKLDILLRVPAIAAAIRDFEAGEFSASLEQRLAAIDDVQIATEAHYNAIESQTQADGDLDRARQTFEIEQQKHATACAETASAARALNAATRTLYAAGEGELETGIQRFGSWINALESELQRIEKNPLRKPDVFSSITLEAVSSRATRIACLRSDIPAAKQKLAELMALRLAPISPEELRLAVSTARTACGMPDVEMLAEVRTRQILREGAAGLVAMPSFRIAS